MLSDRVQTVGWIRMPLGAGVGLGPSWLRLNGKTASAGAA